MNIMDFNKFLRKAFWQDCQLMPNFDTDLFYRIKFRSTLNSEEFIKFADDCEKFLFQYGIRTGAIVALNPEEPYRRYILQINKVPTSGKFSKKLAALMQDNELHEALDQGAILRIKMLLNKGANVNSKNIVGETLLHIAAQKGYDAIVSLVLEEGALINIQNNKGETALQIVDQKNDAMMGRLLIDALLNNDRNAEKPNFIMQELSDYWDVQIQKRAAKSMTERFRDRVAVVSGARTVRNLIKFFSGATMLNDEPALEKPIAGANLGR